jgi:hypothetical protein
MAGNIKVIETSYRGCRFRSRLEARWAVFFDALGWDWQYEKEGYVLGWDKDDRLPWLPDFEVITPYSQHLYVEVKGDPSFFANTEWFRRFDFNGGPPGFPDCGWSDKYTANSKPLIILGDIPRFSEPSSVFYVPLIVHYKGVKGMMAELGKGGVSTNGYFEWDNLDSDDDGIKNFQVVVAKGNLTYYDTAVVADAMRAASGARFEHGEKGASYGV